MSNTTKIHKSGNYENLTSVNNDLIFCRDLLLAEKCLLIFIISMPKDYAISKNYLYDCLPDSKYSINMALSNLIDSGFIKRYKLKNEKGRFTGWHYEVFALPINKKLLF
jgi:predicted transcriptional regulator